MNDEMRACGQIAREKGLPREITPTQVRKRIGKKPHLSEHEIQSQILDYLARKRIFHYRNNSGAFKKGKHYIKFGCPGSPDIVCVIKGQYVALEVKDDKNEQSKLQFNFQRNLELAGGRYFVCRSLEDAVAALR